MSRARSKAFSVITQKKTNQQKKKLSLGAAAAAATNMRVNLCIVLAHLKGLRGGIVEQYVYWIIQSVRLLFIRELRAHQSTCLFSIFSVTHKHVFFFIFHFYSFAFPKRYIVEFIMQIYMPGNGNEEYCYFCFVQRGVASVAAASILYWLNYYLHTGYVCVCVCVFVCVSCTHRRKKFYFTFCCAVVDLSFRKHQTAFSSSLNLHMHHKGWTERADTNERVVFCYTHDEWILINILAYSILS